ncbi:hypothetical protein [Clostridium tetani]|uniref:hypothetical protein n=1 Tax=Clostridium tetani TaxID=1513 RepID=UPI0013E961F0|nr:hypothetical protein [Clostridium tetani]
MKCSNCNKETIGINFCTQCGAKLKDTCSECWVKNRQPYNCGYKKCPGYRLPILEKSKF